VKERGIIGVDIGGTKTAVVEGTDDGRIVRRIQFATVPERGFDSVFKDIVFAVEEISSSATHVIAALSVAVGGPLDVLQGVVLSPPNLPGWDGIPLKKLLRERVAFPVYVEHDGNAGALAEWYFGAGRGTRSMVFLTMGTGVGAGLILDGRLYRGASDVAGEVGHVRIAEDGPDCYGKAGSLEGYASGTGIARLAQSLFPFRWPSAPDVVLLAAAARSGDPDALKVFEIASMFFGRGLAMLADTLNPERIVLGGLGMRLTDLLVAPALRVFKEEALPRAAAVCSIVPAALGESIGDIASLCAALDQGHLLRDS
jgi:glucokinase